MSRQPAFEKLYAKLHDIDPEDLVQYRFDSREGYRLPQMASHYRLYCETMDSMAGELLEAERYRWLRDKSESVHSFYLSVPLWMTGVKFRPENVDRSIDAMCKGENP